MEPQNVGENMAGDAVENIAVNANPAANATGKTPESLTESLLTEMRDLSRKRLFFQKVATGCMAGILVLVFLVCVIIVPKAITTLSHINSVSVKVENSLDEIPQFWNVLKGEMSMVGPRPLVPGELESFGGKPLYMDVRPGMTGWWICHGHHDTTYSERLELEYYYIRNRSFKLDLICIVRMIMPAGKKESEKNGPDRKQKS